MKRTYLVLLFLIFILSFADNASGQTSTPSNSSQTEIENQKADKPVKIKKKPQPRFEPGTCSERVSFVALKVTFDKSAKITNVEIISSSGCQSVEKSTINAAKKIKFEPATKDGEPITVVKRIEYTFAEF